MSGVRVETPHEQARTQVPIASDVAIEIRGLAKEVTSAHGSVLALDHVSLDIRRGE